MNSSDANEPESKRIAREIEQTRQGLDTTLDHLSERLRPESLLADGAIWVADRLDRVDPHAVRAMADQGRRMFDREPAGWTMFAAGLIWMCGRAYVRSTKTQSPGIPGSPGAKAGKKDHTGITLSACLAAAGVGLLAGLAIPRTRTEDEVLGRASDDFIEHSPQIASRGTHAFEEAMLTH